jgi:hypothetical protein
MKITLKSGSSVDAGGARKVLASLRQLKRENPKAFDLLVEKSKIAHYRFPGPDDEDNKSLAETAVLLRQLDLLDADRAVRSLTASVIASALREEEGKTIIGSPFTYEDAA